jgi:hypothetical protein
MHGEESPEADGEHQDEDRQWAAEGENNEVQMGLKVTVLLLDVRAQTTRWSEICRNKSFFAGFNLSHRTNGHPP